MDSYSLALGLAGILLLGYAGLVLLFCLVVVFAICLGWIVSTIISAYHDYLMKKRKAAFVAAPSQSRIDELCAFISRQYKAQTAAPHADYCQTITLPQAFGDVSASACASGLSEKHLYCFEQPPTLLGKRRLSVRPLSSMRQPC